MAEAIRMITRAPRETKRRHNSLLGLVVTWSLVAIGIVAVIFSTGYVFNENLYAYGVCSEPPRTGCSEVGWYSSMSVSVFGGIAAIAIGAILGFRRYKRGRSGAWFPVAGIAAVLALAWLSIVILRVATHS